MLAVDCLFRSTGSYEPDHLNSDYNYTDTAFRSTGSYEPDRNPDVGRLHPSGFDPQALTSLTIQAVYLTVDCGRFRSTGSYEPDQNRKPDEI